MDAPSAPRTQPRRSQQVWWLYLAEVASGLGDGVFWVALVVELSGRAHFGWYLAAAVLVRLGPRAFLSVPAGLLIERANLRLLLIAIDLARASVMVTLTLALAAGLDVRFVLVVVLLSYVIGVPTRPALATVLPHLVVETRLAGANAMLSSIRQVMTFVGPLVGVAVVQISVTTGVAVNGLSFALSAACIAAVHGLPTGRRRGEAGQHHESLADGVRTIKHLHGLPTLMSVVVAMYFVRGAEMVLHVLVVRELLHADPAKIGYLSGAIGLGAILAGPLAGPLVARARVDAVVLASIAVTLIPTALLSTVDSLAGAVLLLVPVGVGMVTFEVAVVITIQRTMPRAMYGRAFGALHGASNSGKLLGAVLMPAIVAGLGVSDTILLVAATAALIGLAGLMPLTRIATVAAHERKRIAPIVEVLAGLDLFDGASNTTLERLAVAVQTEGVPAGQQLLREGDAPDDLFVARSGAFDVSVDGRRVNTMSGGDWFGEIGLVESRPRTATVTATTDAEVWRIPGGVFLDALEHSYAAPSALLEGIATRLARN